MPKKLLDDENTESSVLILESLRQNSESLKKVLDAISSLCVLIEDKYAANTSKILEKMGSLQSDVKNLVNVLQIKSTDAVSLPQANQFYSNSAQQFATAKSPTILRCNSWEDFQTFASQPQAVSFTYRKSDGIFEADALKDNQIVVYIGEIPKVESLLKVWLSSQLKLVEEKVFEGALTKT